MASDTTGQSLFEQGEIAPERAQSIVDEALAGADDGELFLEIRRSEVLSFDDGRLRSASSTATRALACGPSAAKPPHLPIRPQISEAALRRAAETVRAVHSGHSGTIADPPVGTNRRLYGDRDPVAAMGFADKVAAPDRCRRLCPRDRSAGAPGVSVPRRRLAIGRDHKARRPPAARHPPARALQRHHRDR